MNITLAASHEGWIISTTKGATLSIYDSEYLDPEDEDKAVEIRLDDVVFRHDESPAVVLSIKRTCSLSGDTKVGHVTLGQENTLRLYLEN